MWIKSRNGSKRMRKKTIGWKLHVSESWIPLKVMKDIYPIQTVEFACTVGIDKEPAFCW